MCCRPFPLQQSHLSFGQSAFQLQADLLSGAGGNVFRNTVADGTVDLDPAAIQGPLHTSAGAIGSSNGWENFER